MDYLVESIALGIDVIVLAMCFRQYYKNKNAVTMIQGVPYLPINKDLKELVDTHPEKRLSYVSIRGTVKALGKPIVSNNNDSVKGVVQLLSIKEHVAERSSTGFWSDSEHTIQEVYNVMPFTIGSQKHQVEVVDPLSAEVLDLDVIYDVFKPTIPSVMDHIWGFVAGRRQSGVQTMEKMLREGTMLTGIGELVYCNNTKTLRLQPPTNGAPFYLTNMQINSLIKKLDGQKKTFKYLCIFFGAVGVALGSYIVWQYIRKKSKLKESEEIRRRRRQQIRTDDLDERQLCVVCKSNPIEMILLPCGHVCLCEDCSLDITHTCPICRAKIASKSVAYIL